MVNEFKNKNFREGYENVRVMLVGVGHMMGEEDAIKDRHYSTSVACTSQTGKLY